VPVGRKPEDLDKLIDDPTWQRVMQVSDPDYEDSRFRADKATHARSMG
jgi:hypothetical protein